jgi:N utilization substance protein B
LYEVDVTDHGLTDVLSRTTEDTDEVVTETVRTHVDRLVRGAIDKRAQIDKYIGEAAPAFPVNQLPAVDRNVLRLAIYELLSEPDVPRKAAINEAVELAKRFGGMNSSRFVNGVLGTVTDRINAEQTNAPDSAAGGASS